MLFLIKRGMNSFSLLDAAFSDSGNQSFNLMTKFFFFTCVQFKMYEVSHPLFFFNLTLHIPGICVKQMQFRHDRDGDGRRYCRVDAHQQLFCWV